MIRRRRRLVGRIVLYCLCAIAVSAVVVWLEGARQADIMDRRYHGTPQMLAPLYHWLGL